MSIKITQKIISSSVVKDQPPNDQPPIDPSPIQRLHENLVRPASLSGTTYKVKTPLSEHALYITINDIVLNEGTLNETCRPLEMFINSKSMENFQWVVALTRIISAVFRKGGEVGFLVEELQSIFDPKGGYFKKGGKYMPSIVAEIGEVLEQHLITLGLFQRDNSLAQAAQAMIEEKTDQTPSYPAAFPPEATLCVKCQAQAVVILDGCLTCVNCGDSKCG